MSDKSWRKPLNAAFNIGFFGGVACLAAMGVAAVWQEPTAYRVAASGAIVCWVVFGACFALAMMFAEPGKVTGKEAEPTENV